jgi:O-antigen ligase
MWALLFIIILSVYVTFSRTGLICMILLWLIWLVMEKKYVILLLIGFISVASLPFISEYSRGTRFETLFAPDKYDPNGNVFTLNGRVDGIWGQKLQYFFNNPLIGISSAKNIRSNTQFEVVTFDNSFIYMLVTGGIIGLILLIIFHYKLIARFNPFGNSNNRFLFNYLVLLHINIAIFYFTTDLIKMVQFTTFYFFFAGLILTFNHKKNAAADFNTSVKLE